MKNINLTLYAITDQNCLENTSLTEAVRSALEGGITMLQLREKNLPLDKLVTEAKELKALCHLYNVPLIINDNIEACVLSDADGVHLGQNDMPANKARAILGNNKIIGVTAKTTEQAKSAMQMGADYIGSGAVFGTVTKSDAKKMEISTLKEICKSVTIPVTAIGGINIKNIDKLHNTGIKGVAVVSGIFANSDIKQAARALKSKANGIINMNTALTIAGSDCSGGAGIQADLKTMTALGVFGMSAITAITAQNTIGVTSVYDVSEKCLSEQLDSVFTDIFPDSVKIGMVSSSALIHTIAEALKKYKPINIVLDPVMVSTSGHPLLAPDAKSALIEQLFPLADIITPNVPEAESLCGFSISNENSMLQSAKYIYEKFHVRVLLKGGHLNGSDLLYYDNHAVWLPGKHINNPNTHGTGCTLSSAIAAGLAKGYNIEKAIRLAKEYIAGAIEAGLNLGYGNGPINHIWQPL